MRISDWSSDVCSSDLAHAVAAQPAARRQLQLPLEGAVVGQQQQAFGVDVEPPDRLQARQLGGQAVEHRGAALRVVRRGDLAARLVVAEEARRSEEHTSELQSLMRISYAVFCLKKKTTHYT